MNHGSWSSRRHPPTTSTASIAAPNFVSTSDERAATGENFDDRFVGQPAWQSMAAHRVLHTPYHQDPYGTAPGPFEATANAEPYTWPPAPIQPSLHPTTRPNQADLWQAGYDVHQNMPQSVWPQSLHDITSTNAPFAPSNPYAYGTTTTSTPQDPPYSHLDVPLHGTRPLAIQNDAADDGHDIATLAGPLSRLEPFPSAQDGLRPHPPARPATVDLNTGKGSLTAASSSSDLRRQPSIRSLRPADRRESFADDVSTTDNPSDRQKRSFTKPEDARCACDRCGMLFQRGYNLKAHMETHDPHRSQPHACPQPDCGKRFARRTDLVRHENSVHLKRRNFQCPMCHSSYARKDTLARHMEDGCSKRPDVSRRDAGSRELSQAASSRRSSRSP